MKRLATAVMLAALVIAPAAVADPRHGGGGFGHFEGGGRFEGGRVGGFEDARGRDFHGGRGGLEDDRGGEARGFGGYGLGGRGGFGYGGRGGYGGAPHFAPPPRQAPRRYGYGGYGRPPYAAPAPSPMTPAPAYGSWRRGQHLAPAYRGAVVNDYQRYHLRRPPRGYYWTRVGDDFVLTAQGSGLVFDVIGMDGR